jgi:hypothetical protein
MEYSFERSLQTIPALDCAKINSSHHAVDGGPIMDLHLFQRIILNRYYCLGVAGLGAVDGRGRAAAPGAEGAGAATPEAAL